MTPPDRPAERTPTTTPTRRPAAKLTLGQRVLTKLPKLQPGTGGTASRQPAGKAPEVSTPSAKAPAKRPAGRPAPSPGGGSSRGGPPGGGPSRGDTGGGDKADAGGAPATKPLGARLRDSLIKPAPGTSAPGGGAKRQPTKADPFPDKSSEELRSQIRTLDDRERLYTLIAAPLGAAVGITGMIVTLQRNPAVGVKGHQSPSSILLVGAIAIALAVLALVGGLLRKRSFAAFSLMFLGFGASLAGGSFAALPFLGLGLWFIFRSNKMQKALVSRGDHPRQQRARAGGGTRSGAAARGGGANRRAAAARSGSAAPEGRQRRVRRGKAPAQVGPPPNKRYTPPKPKADDR